MSQTHPLNTPISDYAVRLSNVLGAFDWTPVKALAEDLLLRMQSRQQVWVMGNGGSSANATHWANDFLYPIAKGHSATGIKIQALTANTSVVTCLGNDLGYNEIFSYQIRTQATQGDLVIALSGSGNSANILEALHVAKEMNLKSYAILGFDGGKAKDLADVSIHFNVSDMQIAEDCQMIVCHTLVQIIFKALQANPVHPK